MPSPIISITNAASTPISSLNFGNIDAGSASNPIQIYVWNNFQGGQTVSDAINTTITTKTYNGNDAGDSVSNGQEVVTNLSLSEQCTTQGDTAYTSVGGPTTATIGSTAGGRGNIKGSVNGDYAVVNLQLTAPTNVTPGPVSLLLRCNFSYT